MPMEPRKLADASFAMARVKQALTECQSTVTAAIESTQDRRLDLLLQSIEAGLHWLEEEPWNAKEKCFGESENVTTQDGPELA